MSEEKQNEIMPVSAEVEVIDHVDDQYVFRKHLWYYGCRFVIIENH